MAHSRIDDTSQNKIFIPEMVGVSIVHILYIVVVLAIVRLIMWNEPVAGREYKLGVRYGLWHVASSPLLAISPVSCCKARYLIITGIIELRSAFSVVDDKMILHSPRMVLHLSHDSIDVFQLVIKLTQGKYNRYIWLSTCEDVCQIKVDDVPSEVRVDDTWV